jgi:hypothetical protein
MDDDPIDERALVAHLGPARSAMIAGSTALIVEHKHAVADLEEVTVDARSNLGDHAAGLMPADDRRVRVDPARGEILEAKRLDDLGGLVPVEVQIAAAHARRLHLDHDLVVFRDRVIEL